MTPPVRRQPGRAVGVPDYLWDARLGNYVNRATGRMVKRTAIQEALGAVCDRGASTLAGIAQAGQNGTLTPRQFYEAMQREVRQLYNASAALGRGGWAQMRPADWGRVGRALRDEYGRLRDFAQGLADGTISEKQAVARARLYADSAFRQYWKTWGGLQEGLGNDEEIWETSQDELVCKICRGLEALGWQPIGTLPEPGDPHPGDRCSKSYRRAGDARLQPARPPAPDRAAILPPQLAALARARLTQTALASLALTAELRRPGLHYGPGPHPDGSSQSVHGGGNAAGAPKLPPIRFTGTAGAMTERANERRKLMEQAYPGVRFSTYVPNPQAWRRQEHAGIPAHGEPGAIYDPRAPAQPDAVPQVAAACARWGPVEGGPTEPGWSGYARFNTLRAATGLDYARVFGAVNAMRAQDPYGVRVSVDRLGNAVYVQIKRGVYA